MATVGELITRVLAPLRDADQNLFADPELIAYFNEAVVDLCARERLIREVADIVTSGGTLAIPDDVLQVRWTKNESSIEVAWMDESTFFDYQLTFPDQDPNQPLATIYDNKIWIHPAPSDGETWPVGYYGIPAVLTSDASVFPLRRVWEEKAIRYVRAECYYKLGDTALADRDMSQYESGLRPSSGITDHQVPGHLNFALERNVFDADPQSIHRGI